MTGLEAMRACFERGDRQRRRKILGLEGYGLAPGCHADLVVLQAATRSRRSGCAGAAVRHPPRENHSRDRTGCLQLKSS